MLELPSIKSQLTYKHLMTDRKNSLERS